jgi:glycosyltransferase involved in cell wall biosynthesis
VDTAVTVIVPVYNGETSLLRALASVACPGPRPLEVLIALNGCSDGSLGAAEAGARLIEQAGGVARMVLSDEPSRAGALNAAEALARGHRVYLDQDAVLSPRGLTAIVAALDSGKHFVSGAATWRSNSALVRAAMGAWNDVPYVQRSPVSAGMYAVSEEGRKRWGAWPAALPDDKFARLQFEVSERLALRTVTYEVDAPDTFRGLIEARKRYASYNAALREHAPELLRRDLPRMTEAGKLLLRPDLWGGLALLSLAELATTFER